MNFPESTTVYLKKSGLKGRLYGNIRHLAPLVRYKVHIDCFPNGHHLHYIEGNLLTFVDPALKSVPGIERSFQVAKLDLVNK